MFTKILDELHISEMELPNYDARTKALETVNNTRDCFTIKYYPDLDGQGPAIKVEQFWKPIPFPDQVFCRKILSRP